MKKQETTFRLTILYMITVFMFVGCQKDDDNLSDVQQQIQDGGSWLRLERLINPNISNNSKLSGKFHAINQERNLKNSGTMAREVYNPELDFTVDTSIANYISYGNYHSYTFPVSRTVDNGLLENVLLSLQADGTYVAYLISYDITEAERELLLNNEQVPNLNDKMSSTILLDGAWTSTILQRSGGSCWDWQIVTPRCPYEGRHTAEDILTGSNNGFNCRLFNEGGSVGGSYSVAMEVDCEEFNAGGGYSWENPNYGNPDGNDYALPDVGSGGPTDPNNPDPNPNEGDDCDDGLSTGFVDANGNCIPNTTVVVVKDANKKECNKIKNVLNLNPQFKAQLIAEANGVATATNEKMLTLRHKENSSDTTNKMEEFIGVSGKVDPDKNPSTKYIAMGHNHDGQNTYSVLSLGDLIFVAGVDMINNKVDMSNFVSFLYTTKGTRYAFTINNVSKFRDFFEFVKWQKDDITPEQVVNYLAIAKRRENIFKKYYSGDDTNPATPFIKENAPASQNEMQLRMFVNFLVEIDGGISIFEVDNSFENYTEITKKSPTELNRNNCNN